MAENLTLRESIQLAVTTEQLGRDFYLKMAEKFSSENEISGVFSRLAEDERVHEGQFRKLLDSVPQETVSGERDERYEFLKATAISEFFRQEYFSKAGEISTGVEALGKALAFEKATLQYYRAIREVLGKSEQLDAIIEAERNHVLSLVRIIPTEAVFRGMRDTL
jgi:rubrerythrin